LEYSYYMGCQVPAQLPNYDLATRKVAESLDIKLIDLLESGCCGCVIRSVNPYTWIALSTRILAMAERTKHDLITICPGCYTTLVEVQSILSEKPSLRKRMNTILEKESLIYKGEVKVKHLLTALYFDKGIEEIKKAVTNSLKGLKVAVHYGCHLNRSHDYQQYDDPESPHILDNICEVTGAESVYWPLKLWCCGGMTNDQELSFKLGNMKLKDAKASGADCIVTACPFCQIQFDNRQRYISSRFNEDYNIPVLTFTQLLGLAFGIKEEDLGLQYNRVPVEELAIASNKDERKRKEI